MKDHCELLLYLDKNKILEHMQNECATFLSDQKENLFKFPPFRYHLEVDVMALLDEFPYVGQLLLAEPLRWRKICTNILFSCLQTVDHSIQTEELVIQEAQVGVLLNIKCLPQPLAVPNKRYYQGLTCFQGILIDISKPANCLINSVWLCPEQCDNTELILNHIPKMSPKCLVCRSVLVENKAFRRCCEQVQATFMFKNDLLCRKFKITDDQFGKLTLGKRYNLIGAALKNNMFIWSVEMTSALVAPVNTSIPREISELNHKCRGTPWKFIYFLASSIGPNICPLHCFMHLKISLLLSLSSVMGNIYTGCSIIHVLAVGLDTGYVNQIMQVAAELANHATSLGVTDTSLSSTLIASSGGVSILPLPLDACPHKQISALLSAIESNEVTMENGRAKVHTAVWAHGMNIKKIPLYNVANVFGTVCREDFEEYVDDIAEFVLVRAVECSKLTKEEDNASRDIKKYLDSIAGIHVELSNEAEDLLQNYFLAARKKRSQEVSVGSLGALVAICLASARLCRRDRATVEDAIFAVWMHVSGGLDPRSAPEEYLQAPDSVKTLHKNMNKFIEWLKMFIGNVLL